MGRKIPDLPELVDTIMRAKAGRLVRQKQFNDTIRAGGDYVMAARLTDIQKKKIIADYVQIGSYNAVSKIHGVSATTVKNVVLKSADIVEKCEQKKEQNTLDMLAYMESKRQQICDILQAGLDVLPDKIKNAKSASEVTTAMGTLIDKWAMISGGPADTAKEDELSRSLRALADELCRNPE